MNYAPHSDKAVAEMLEVIGVSSIEELFADVPAALYAKSFNLQKGLSEYEVVKFFDRLGKKNNSNLISFLGGGFYDHYIPSVVDYIASRGEFSTAYTPYQPEASQGTLQVLYEYQSAVCQLTGMDASNASLYDGGSAIVEAVLMAIRITKRSKVIVDKGLNPLYRRMLHTAIQYRDIEIVEVPTCGIRTDTDRLISLTDGSLAAVVVENPNFFGEVADYQKLAESAHAHKALLIVSCYPISLGMIKTPAEMGADIVTAEGQSLGNYLNFGGPYLGIIATKNEYIRNLPGRIAGRTTDKNGKTAYVLTLQAREQHIRRQKATSNICSNQSLCALRALVFLSLLGSSGFTSLAQTNHSKAIELKERLESLNGIRVENNSFFNTFVLSLPVSANVIVHKLLQNNIAGGIALGSFYPDIPKFHNAMLVTVTEKVSNDEMDLFCLKLKECL